MANKVSLIDTFADRIVGWRVSRSAKADFVLDALEQALHDRRPVQKGGLIHHSDRGGQYLSIRYTERLAEAGIETDIRRLLIVGAMSVIRWVVRKVASANRWLAALVARNPKMVAAVALANKMARMIWALSTKQENYRMA